MRAEEQRLSSLASVSLLARHHSIPTASCFGLLIVQSASAATCLQIEPHMPDLCAALLILPTTGGFRNSSGLRFFRPV